MGDPAGIGPEITLKSWLRRAEAGLPAFCYFGDADYLRHISQQLGLSVPIETIGQFAETRDVFRFALPVFPLPLERFPHPGDPHHEAAPRILASIEAGTEHALSGAAAALVTNPIAKEPLRRAGFAHAGHTEFLGELARAKGLSATPVMLLASPTLRVVPATIHIPLSQVPTSLSQELIASTAEILIDGLQKYFNFMHPRIAITGLNPHAGEGGMMGREEIDIIAPAIALLKDKGYAVSGPHSADTLFHQQARRTYDAVIAMYHDQALIPIKTLAFDEGVNVTLGLPFIRTSPDHGTAFDIAGTGRARPDSLMHALRLARNMAAARLVRARGARS